MTNHPAQPGRGEIGRGGAAGRISGATAVPVAAEHVRVGDVLILDDGACAGVTDVRFGQYWLRSGCGDGVALGWRSGSSSGVMFRRRSDLLLRLPADSL
jgi:hypothetical protein